MHAYQISDTSFRLRSLSDSHSLEYHIPHLSHLRYILHSMLVTSFHAGKMSYSTAYLTWDSSQQHRIHNLVACEISLWIGTCSTMTPSDIHFSRLSTWIGAVSYHEVVSHIINLKRRMRSTWLFGIINIVCHSWDIIFHCFYLTWDKWFSITRMHIFALINELYLSPKPNTLLIGLLRVKSPKPFIWRRVTSNSSKFLWRNSLYWSRDSLTTLRQRCKIAVIAMLFSTYKLSWHMSVCMIWQH